MCLCVLEGRNVCVCVWRCLGKKEMCVFRKKESCLGGRNVCLCVFRKKKCVFKCVSKEEMCVFVC